MSRIPLHRRLFLLDAPDGPILYAPLEARAERVDAARARRLAAQIEASRASTAPEPSPPPPFQPACLTLLMTTECALDCTYCYARASREPRLRTTPEIARAGARFVADSCRRRGLGVLTLGLHGGGEPLLHRRLAEACVEEARRAAADAGLGLATACTTSGAIPEATARWAARTIDRVTISVDGPPDIHDQSRKTRIGGGSSAAALRTARIVACGAELHVRMTVLPEDVGRLPDAIGWVVETLGPARIVVEPVYAPAGAEAAPRRDGLEPFPAEAFAASVSAARAAGAPVVWASARPGDLHGPFCTVAQDNLTLTPDGLVTACFRVTRGDGPPPLLLGHVEQSSGVLRLDFDKIRSFLASCARIPAECTECPSQWHCARGCPDVCAALEGEAQRGGARCEVSRRLLLSLLEAETSG